MKSLQQAVLDLDLSKAERNTFSQLMRMSVWEKHFKNLSREHLETLKAQFEKQLAHCKKLFKNNGTVNMFHNISHCEYALDTISGALQCK